MLFDLGCQDYRKPVITDWYLSKDDRIHNGVCMFCMTCDIIQYFCDVKWILYFSMIFKIKCFLGCTSISINTTE